MKRRLISVLLAVILVTGTALPAGAWDHDTDRALAATAGYLLTAVPDPQVGSVGGEWLVLGLARSGTELPEGWLDRYQETVASYVSGRDGVLHTKKYTEYARVVLALTAIGADPRNVAGYDLTAPMLEYDKVIWQGLNGPVWALLALDAGNYPAGEIRQAYVDLLVDRQLSGGGWSLTEGGGADMDITAMVLQALAKYREQPAVQAAVDRGLDFLSTRQGADGGFGSCECTAQVVVALCELGLELSDSRFVKNGCTALDGLMAYALSDGSFRHTLAEPGSNQMATEQAFYALAAVRRAENGQSSLYCMTAPDALTVSVKELMELVRAAMARAMTR